MITGTGTGIVAGVAGLLFAVGLGLGGMTDPNVVRGFLDIGGAWNPSLALVMFGAIAVFAPVYWRLIHRGRSLCGAPLRPPSGRRVDSRLLVGSALFGVGWGLLGYCPGPALVSAVAGGMEVLAFVVSMLLGMVAFAVFDARGRGA